MSIVISTELDVGYDQFGEVEKVTREVLADYGFGVLTEIDAKAVLKKKIDADIKAYKILGACNPPVAHKAIILIPEVGALLPCNFIIYENKEGKIVVSAMNPKEALSLVKNSELDKMANEVTDILTDAIKDIENRFS